MGILIIPVAQGKVAINIVFESRAQLERIRKAARLRKWSINTFMLDAAEKQMAVSPPEQLNATNEQPPANQ
jgi:uncharacterized protein (DUF1778 family)